MKNFKTKLAIISGVAALSIYSAGAMAATQNVTVNMNFDTPLSLTKNADIAFGTVTAGTVSTYKITSAGVVSTVSGSGQYFMGTKHAASISIAGSSTSTIDISAGNYSANNGVTPSAATCAYNGGAEGACGLTAQAAPGAGKTLLIGVTAAVDGTQADGSAAAPTFDITVSYT